ncbi:MAG: hypothetical protein V4671_12805 [Armatimonadota bacterium]
MSNRANQAAFEEFVTGPLVRLVGTPLHSVEYYALDCVPDFDANHLTESGGCQGVHLTFDGGEVEVDWANVPDLRDPEGDIAYHLMVRHLLEGQASEILHGRTPVDATEVLPWKTVIGEALRSVTVHGFLQRFIRKEDRSIPQAVEFTFSSARIFVIFGMTGTTLSLGSGNEILVFSAEEWAGLQPDDFFAGGWPVPLWQSGSAGTQ